MFYDCSKRFNAAWPMSKLSALHFQKINCVIKAEEHDTLDSEYVGIYIDSGR